MTDLRRSPIPGIFRGLRMFLFAYAASLTVYAVFLYAFFRGDGIEECYLQLLFFSASYAIIFACLETIASKAILTIVIIGCVSLDLLLLPGFPLGTTSAKPHSLFPYLMCIALLLVFSVGYRISKDKVKFGSSALCGHIMIFVVISLISGFLETGVHKYELLSTLLYYSALSYIPLGVASIFSESVCGALDGMMGKTTQPHALFRRRLTGFSLIILLSLCAFLFMLPIVDFTNLYYAAVTYLFKGYMWLIEFLGQFKFIPPINPIDPHPNRYVTEIQGPRVDVPDYCGYISLAVVGLAALELLRRLIFKAIGSLKAFYSSEYRTANNSKVSASRYDTVEELERIKEKKAHTKLTAEQSNAQKVRRIYKKKVASILGDKLDELACKSPEEIIRLALEHGFDISELTRIYKKARYTDCCSDTDVSSARKSRPAKA